MLQNICQRSFLIKTITKSHIRRFGAITTTHIDEENNSNYTNEHYKTDPQQHLDEFTKEFIQNRIEMTPFQKWLLSAGSSVAALLDPKRFVNLFVKLKSLDIIKRLFTRVYIIWLYVFFSNRHDMIACLGETTGEQALQNILHTMRTTEEGQRILQHKPRINTRTVDIEQLRRLPENTFGRAYIKFLDDNVRNYYYFLGVLWNIIYLFVAIFSK